MIRELIVTTVVTCAVVGAAFITWAVSFRYGWPLWIYTAAVSWWFIRQLDPQEMT